MNWERRRGSFQPTWEEQHAHELHTLIQPFDEWRSRLRDFYLTPGYKEAIQRCRSGSVLEQKVAARYQQQYNPARHRLFVETYKDPVRRLEIERQRTLPEIRAAGSVPIALVFGDDLDIFRISPILRVLLFENMIWSTEQIVDYHAHPVALNQISTNRNKGLAPLVDFVVWAHPFLTASTQDMQ